MGRARGRQGGWEGVRGGGRGRWGSPPTPAARAPPGACQLPLLAGSCLRRAALPVSSPAPAAAAVPGLPAPRRTSRTGCPPTDKRERSVHCSDRARCSARQRPAPHRADVGELLRAHIVSTDDERLLVGVQVLAEAGVVLRCVLGARPSPAWVQTGDQRSKERPRRATRPPAATPRPCCSPRCARRPGRAGGTVGPVLPPDAFHAPPPSSRAWKRTAWWLEHSGRTRPAEATGRILTRAGEFQHKLGMRKDRPRGALGAMAPAAAACACPPPPRRAARSQPSRLRSRRSRRSGALTRLQGQGKERTALTQGQPLRPSTRRG